MLVKSHLPSKDTSLWSSGICNVLIASMKSSVYCSLCRNSSVKGLRMLVLKVFGKLVSRGPTELTRLWVASVC